MEAGTVMVLLITIFWPPLWTVVYTPIIRRRLPGICRPWLLPWCFLAGMDCLIDGLAGNWLPSAISAVLLAGGVAVAQAQEAPHPRSTGR
jgi:hypothetical protein